MTNDELIYQLRRAADIWFKNSDLLLLEELIRRYRNAYRNAYGNATREQNDS